MLVSVVESLTAAGVTGVVVVTHTDVASAVSRLLPEDVFIALNDDADTEMIHSIRIGLDEWNRRAGIAGTDGILVLPGDQPGIPPRDIESCVSAFLAAPEHIVVATRAGHRGHPMIFPGALTPIVRSSACDAGLRELARVESARVHDVACASQAVLRDIDTASDYEALL